jgi:23S rRNA pseudouridine955/2504/2580 synthase
MSQGKQGRQGRRGRQKARRHPESRGADRREKPKAGRSFAKPNRDAPKRGEAKRDEGGRTPAAAAPARPQRPPTDERRLAREPRKPESASATTTVQTVTVAPDESGMRIDRFLESKFPGLSFSHIQRIIRKGELRVNGKRREPKDRLEAGQAVRIPPLRLEAPPPRPGSPKEAETKAFLKSITLYEDDDVMVLNKPMGLAVQGGSGTARHIDGMLGVLTARDGQRPRLVHRLDKDTSGCLLVAKNRFSAAALAKTFRSRSARKIYWALVPGVPKPKQGRISTYLAKEEREDDSVMRVAKHGEEGASHAVTYYAVVETAAHKLAWLSLKPVTGRTHQLRVQLAHIEHPIVGDPKYFNIENWELPGGIQNRLHLLARRIAVPHPRGGAIDVTAPIPPHMQQSWNLLGFDAKRYDPIEDSPEE